MLIDMVEAHSVQELIPFFPESDSIIYLRYGSWYIEKMRLLPKEHPDIYHQFLSGKFVVQTIPGHFKAVSPDMKLEQTIQCSKKLQRGIIGQTSKEAYITEWELVYHEVLNITNFSAKLTNIQSGYSEVELKECERIHRNADVDPLEYDNLLSD